MVNHTLTDAAYSGAFKQYTRDVPQAWLYPVALSKSAEFYTLFRQEKENPTLSDEELREQVRTFLLLKYHLYALGNLRLGNTHLMSKSSYCAELLAVNKSSWPERAYKHGAELISEIRLKEKEGSQ